VLLRLVANGSRFFPERRVFLNDLEGALTWATAAPSRDDVPGRPA
jgi:hypothetical protein